MRQENGGGEDVTYICDVCQATKPGRAYAVHANQQQSTQPVDWFTLNVRHDHGEPRERLKAHLCSPDCAAEQIRRWAA